MRRFGIVSNLNQQAVGFQVRILCRSAQVKHGGGLAGTIDRYTVGFRIYHQFGRILVYRKDYILDVVDITPAVVDADVQPIRAVGNGAAAPVITAHGSGGVQVDGPVRGLARNSRYRNISPRDVGAAGAVFGPGAYIISAVNPVLIAVLTADQIIAQRGILVVEGTAD